MINTNQILVESVDRTGVRVAVNGEHQTMTWASLSEAAGQADPGLSAVYRQIDHEAKRLARDLKALTIRVRSHTSGATYVAETFYVSGEFAGHPAGVGYADGMSHAHYSLAKRDALDASEILRRHGYDVIVEI
jgi:hypothetical protein